MNDKAKKTISALLVWGMLIAAVLLSFAIHSFFLIDGYGEPDACEFGIIALQWHQHGELYRYMYYVRTSILYLQMLKGTMDWGLSPERLPFFMNVLNAMAGSILLIPYYFLWKKIGDKLVAAMALVFLSFAPSFWIGTIYGMPHIPALMFFGTAMLLFLYYLDMPGIPRYGALIAAYFFAVLTVGFKADVLLCYGAFAGLVFLRKKILCREMLFALSIPVLALLFVMLYPKWLFANLSSFTQFSAQWNQSFPFNFRAWLDIKNVGSTVAAMGIVFTVLSLLAWGWTVVRKQHFRHLIFVLSWCLPSMLFWTLKMGNSARHMVSAVIPILFFTSLIIRCRFRNSWWLWSFVCCVIVSNYFICPEKLLPRTYRPSSRLFKAQPHIQAFVSRWHELGKQFVASDAPRKVLVGQCYIRYAEWEMFCAADVFVLSDNRQFYRVIRNGREFSYAFLYDECNNPIPLLLRRFAGWDRWNWVSEQDNKVFRLVHTENPESP